MANNKYTIRYSSTYINQFNSILKYIVNNLKNKIAAKNYTIFYIVKDNTMEIRRILYSRRNFDKLI